MWYLFTGMCLFGVCAFVFGDRLFQYKRFWSTMSALSLGVAILLVLSFIFGALTRTSLIALIGDSF